MIDVQELRALIEAERERFGVPGVAVAVVAGGEVLLCDGFGLRDVEAQEPVTAQTLFPIASDTKCFTAATLCALADDGLLDLDAPVRSYIPWFEMADPHATALVSTRDLLSHRTGLPRHDLVWYGETELELETVVRLLKHLPLNKQPRQTWQYNNLCYNTAGYLTERLAGMPWAEAVEQRLLKPLGMTSTRLSPLDPDDDEMAFPYNARPEGLERQVVSTKARVGPAGGIVSNVTDMAQWVLARLGKREVLTSGALADLHTPAMVGGVGLAAFDERQPMGYALGCQVESYRGTRIIRHGGNLVGYSSDVCVVPSLDAAVVVLTNMHGTALRDALALMVIDRLLGVDPAPWGERYHELMTAMLAGRSAAGEHHASSAAGRPPTRPLEEFAARYEHPAYGTLTLSVVDGALKADFHGLGDRLALEHRDRDVWDLVLREFDTAIPVVFTTGANAEISGLTVPLEPLVPPIAFARARPEVAPGLLEQVVGSYEMGPHTVEVKARGEGLVATVPGAGALQLEPAGGTRFTSPSMSTVSVEFELVDGEVARMIVDPVGIFTRVTSG